MRYGSKRLCAGCRELLHAAEGKAIEDQENAKRRFRDWVKTKVPDAEYMNICSGPQVTYCAATACNPCPCRIGFQLGFLHMGSCVAVKECTKVRAHKCVGCGVGAGSFTCL